MIKKKTRKDNHYDLHENLDPDPEDQKLKNIAYLSKIKMQNIPKNEKFIKSCKNYHLVESNIDKINDLDKYRIAKLFYKMNKAQDLLTLSLLSDQVGKIYYDNKFRNLNKFGFIEKTCNNLSKFIGDTNKNEMKIGKYLNKLKYNNKDKYIEKINDYANNMTGGNLTKIDQFDDNNETYIRNIVEGRYKLISDLELVKNTIKHNNVLDCSSSKIFDIDDDTNFKNYDYNLKLGCFQSIVSMIVDKERSDKIYMFKKYFNTLFTDTYLQNYLDTETYSIMTNYLYFTLTSIFKEYIQIYNTYNNIKLDQNDIIPILLYRILNMIMMLPL